MIGFPLPVDWALDEVSGFVKGQAAAGFEVIAGGLTAWVVDAVVWVVGSVFGFFVDSTDPNVQADWFVTGDGPYATTLSIGASLLLFFVFCGIIEGVVNGDVAGMLRRMILDLPVSVLGMVALVTVTQSLIALTDALSAGILENFADDISEFGAVVATLERLNGGQSTAFVILVLGIITVLAGLVLVAELVIRSALIYFVVALAPLVFACRVWPSTRNAARKLLELLVALIVSKLVIAIALAIAAAAAVGSGSGGEVTALPTPEVWAEDPGGSVTQAVGILLTVAAAFLVAAFSPLLVARLLPVTEAAAVGQGVKGAPFRAAQQGAMVANTTQMMAGRRRWREIAGGSSSSSEGQHAGGALNANAGSGAAGKGAGGAAGGAGSSGGAAAAGGPAGVAAVAAVGAVKATSGAVKQGADAAARSTAQHTEAGSSPAQPPPADRPGATRDAGTTRGGGSSSGKPAPSAPPHPGPPTGGGPGGS